MKKNYTISLDQDQVEKLQGFLNKFELSLSGFFNDILYDANGYAELISYEMDDSKVPFKKARKKIQEDCGLEVGVFQ